MYTHANLEILRYVAASLYVILPAILLVGTSLIGSLFTVRITDDSADQDEASLAQATSIYWHLVGAGDLPGAHAAKRVVTYYAGLAGYSQAYLAGNS